MALPGKESKTIRKVRLHQHQSGNRTWVGKIHDAAGEFTTVLTYGPAGMVGEVRTPDGTYVVESRDGTPILIDVDAAGWQRPPFADDIALPSSAPASTAVAESANLVDAVPEKSTPTPQATVDVLVAYTHALVTRAGSDAGARLRIDQLVAIANQAYIDSEVAITLRLVHAQEVSYPENNDNAVALDDLSAGVNGLSEPYSTLRNRYGADVVVLLRPFNYPGQVGCGIAWLGGYGGNGASIGGQSNLGYAVVSDGSDINGSGYYCSNVAFAHEIGHNMGAMHDRNTVTQGGTQTLRLGAYSYSFGYVHNASWNSAYGSNVCNAGSGASCFGTVMSYITTVSEPKFSNPAISTCPLSQPCGTANDNVALTLNNTRQGIAGWRATKVPFTGTLTGNGQSTSPNTQFALPLKVVVRDATGAAVPGVMVLFAAPASGASASLSAQSVTTDATGTASVTATANGTTGSYVVTATASSGLVAAPFSFGLTNSGPSNMVTVQVIGAGTVSGSNISCPSTCAGAAPSGSSVTLTATPSAGNAFMGWLGACTGTGTCTVMADRPRSVSATFASSSLLPVRIDIDADNRYDGLSDGTLILRHLSGLSGNPLTQGALGSGATRQDPILIATHLTNILPRLDIDGDGRVDAATDGMLVLRYLFGFRGDSLIQNAIAPGALRQTSAAIETTLRALLP